jgi:hypothetical protein
MSMNRNAPLSDSLPSCELRGPLERHSRTAFGKKAIKSDIVHASRLENTNARANGTRGDGSGAGATKKLFATVHTPLISVEKAMGELQDSSSPGKTA